ncbi:MAG TPA: mannitol-1-phosphate 5-dehydrogenase [Candidatus Hydrogenedentes bacterium]|nr:mannitol-1-phosphate 5-dehydrogenase [Candidatus Hydrogenedentota bacterium]
MKKALQFGAGNIGRGFLGQLFFESGYATTFVDVTQPLIDALNARGGYPIRILGDHPETLLIENVRALNSRDVDAVAQSLAESDLAATAVGVNVLPRIAPAIAAGIERRFESADHKPLNIIVCENLLDAGPILREHVQGHLPHRFHGVLEEHVGFVEASIGRMVPVMNDVMRAEDELLIGVEAYCELPVDKAGFRGPIPTIKNMQPRENFSAYVERKLFVHNAGHAVTAYLGYHKGCEYIWQAIADEAVRAEVDAAMSESCAGLVRKHGMDVAALEAHKNDLLRRFANRQLGDQVERVARDPIRKLGSRDRLVGAALMCLNQGIAPEHLAFAAAAAIRYDHPADPAAQQIQELFRKDGLASVLRAFCGIQPESELGTLIAAGMSQLEREKWVR